MESEKIIQSPNDKRQYKLLKLENHLTCLLISDPETDKSAASMNVNIGATDDPSGFSGLAHFLEHMLFLGTEKYPNEAEYHNYINSNAGSNNAYTDLLDTNYYFDCSNKAFKEALDRFAQFFIKPLFTEDLTSREMNAVNSEHEKNLQQDNWRRYQLFKSSAIPGHPYNSFSTGNLKTLNKPGVREALLTFYKNYYSANIMNLVLLSSEPIETLETLVSDTFKLVPNASITRPKYAEPAFGPEQLTSFWRLVPVKEQHSLDVVWMLPNNRHEYKSDPYKYISFLFGHEGENSLLSLLIDEGLALELSSSHSISMDLFVKFQIGIQLTKKGLENHKEVVKIVFAYLRMLKEKNVEKRIYEEIKLVDKIKFDFIDKQRPSGYVTGLSSRLRYYPAQDALRLHYMYEEFNAEHIKKTIEAMTLENMRIYMSSQTLEAECKETEPIYGTKYSVEPISQELRGFYANPDISGRKSKKVLDLPPENVFLPKNLSVLTPQGELPKYPTKVYESEHTQVWHKQDDKFKTPKAAIRCIIHTNDEGFGLLPKTMDLASLWVGLITDYTREMKYPADLAGISSSFRVDDEGVEISCSGFNDSLEPYLIKFFEKLKEFKAEDWEERFDNLKEKKLRNKKNFFKNSPVSQASTFRSIAIHSGASETHPAEAVEILKSVTFKNFVDFHKEWLKTTRATWLVAGNISKEQSTRIGTTIESFLKQFHSASTVLPVYLVPEVRVVNIGKEEEWFYEFKIKAEDGPSKETNSAIVSYYQLSKEVLRRRLLMNILANYLKEPCFNTLRTTEQLGYIVSGTDTNDRGILAYYIYIQSSVKCPQYLSERIKTFVDSMRKKVEELTDEEFKKFADSVKIKILEKDFNIVQETERYWREVRTNRFLFDRKEASAKEIDDLKKDELKALFEEVFYKESKHFECHVVSENQVEENNKAKADVAPTDKVVRECDSIYTLKRRMPLYPDYYSSQ
jgi:insulysin